MQTVGNSRGQTQDRQQDLDSGSGQRSVPHCHRNRLSVVLCTAASARELSPAIVGGQAAPAGSFGFMAFVLYQDGQTDFACSGTVISSNVVLTAGHCGEDASSGTVDQPGGYRVVTGGLDRTDTATSQVSGVSQVIVFPFYTPATADADAALLVLSTPTTVSPIPLASNAAGDLALLDAGTGGEIAGWGATASEPLTAQLQWGQDVVQSLSNCVDHAFLLGAPFDSSYELCAIDAPTYADGACEGDSGGPLVAQRSDQTWIEIGIVSRVPTDCDTAQPDFFTRADAISSWAQSWIGAVAPPARARPLPGVYKGETSQHRKIAFHVGASALALTFLKFGFVLRCARHRPLGYAIAPLTAGMPRWYLTGELDLSRRFRDTDGTQYRIAGAFTAAGAATGTLSISWSNSPYGSCSSGPIRWHATLAG
ncbi:MAG: S1 family peptidase [Solirubrobacteraceae bacterium]